MRRGVRRAVAWLLAVLVGWSAAPAAAQETPAEDELPPPWELVRLEDGAYWLEALARLRAHEDAYRDTPQWGYYTQFRAQHEAAAGNRAAALRWWDAGRRPRTGEAALPGDARAVDAVAYLTAVADTAQVLMINEAHHDADHRRLTRRLLAPLYARGYRYLALEALAATDTSLAARGHAVMGRSGTYTDEATFGALVREALALGYTLVPYEEEPSDPRDETLTPQQNRDRLQAQHLAERIFADDPGARVLVHAGVAHVHEAVTPRWHPMAAYFRTMTGIDPVTVDQVDLGAFGDGVYAHPLRRAARGRRLMQDDPVVLVGPDGRALPLDAAPVDVHVLAPDAPMAWAGREAVDVTVPGCPQAVCVAELRRAGEPEDAVPLDRATVDAAGTVRLWAPPAGDHVVVVRAADGTLLDRIALTPRSP